MTYVVILQPQLRNRESTRNRLSLRICLITLFVTAAQRTTAVSMKAANRRTLLIEIVFGIALSPGTQLIVADEPSPALAVLIDNKAQVPASNLAKAQRDAANVFRQAGIGIRWLECSFDEAGHRDPPGCRFPSDIPALMLRILPEAEARRWNVPRTTLGFCLDNDVYILFTRVQELAVAQHASASIVLAQAMAHEIGHCLGATHSSEGLMRARLRSSDWERAAKGQLLLTPKSAQLLRERLSQRKPLQRPVP